MTDKQTPTIRHDEGYRRTRTAAGAAEAGYRICHLSNGTFTVSIRAHYSVGNYSGVAFPAAPQSTRQDCVDAFLRRAQRHFSQPLTCGVASGAQREAQAEMLDLLGYGLFGFLEPAADVP